MRILFIGGKLDGQLKDIDQPISPLVPTSIKATLDNGIIVEYHVHFFQGEKMQFPLAVFEGIGPDQVFQMLLRWYAAKPMVRVVRTPKPADPPADPPVAADHIVAP